MNDLNPPIFLLAAFSSAFPNRQPTHIIHVPGRSMWIAASTEQTAHYNIHVPDLDSRTSFSLRSARVKKTVLNRPLPRWARYPAGVIRTLCANGMYIDGVDTVVVGEEAQGLRYEYGLGIAIAALWHHLTDTPYGDDTLRDLVERVRRDYVEA